MIEIVTQKALQGCGRLGFCYLCGKPFAQGEELTRDHVPPRAIFLEPDRGDPLILPAHPDCNQGESGEDELVGQLVSALHERFPRPERVRLQVALGHLGDGTKPIGFTRNINLDRIVWRWVRGFHAALYGEHLPRTTRCFVHVPFPRGRVRDGEIELDPMLPQQEFVPGTIKKNRVARNLDCIACWNRKCIYECVYVHADDGDPICFWALRVYDWEKLADPRLPAGRGCIGGYEPPQGIPPGASVDTNLSFPFPNRDPLSPSEK